MKTKFFRSAVPENKKHGAMACLMFVCLISIDLTSAGVQLSNQKRITAMQVGAAAEGARVTIVSDSALNDYEAFRRGDRFYVKIPSAEFTSAVPRLRADGFEDVQGQKVGDSVIVSFKLQPGASARVDQRSNRLDVVFSAPGRNLFNSANGATNRVGTGAGERGSGAGPSPPGSAAFFREEAITENSRSGNGRRASQNSLLPNNFPANATSLSTTNVAANSPSPVVSPSSLLAPAAYPPLMSATPAAPASSKPAVSSTAANGFFNWKTRGRAALRWVSANHLATLPGALIVLSLIFYLTMVLPRRRKNLRAKRVDVPKVQPKIQAKYSGADFDQVGGDGLLANPAAVNSENNAWVLTRPPITSPTAGLGEQKEEREVFEL
ncbi:MAG TPA: hypothetical protein VF899_16360 [Pyrinomonadaceae bacterium]